MFLNNKKHQVFLKITDVNQNDTIKRFCENMIQKET